MTVYILKFDRPLGNPFNPRGQAQYYIGYCVDGTLESRLADHRAGRGAAITCACNARGITYEVVAQIDGDRSLERKLKSYKNTRKLLKKLPKGV